MKIDILTLFPESVAGVLGESIIGRAAKKGIVSVSCTQIRDFTENRQMQVDDYPYGGGWGMVMMAQPLKSCLDSVMSTSGGLRSRVIYLSPQGTPYTQAQARRLARDYDHLVLVCGHYEGVDERFIEACCDEEISLGDFVLTGGEIAAMAVADSVCRLIPGVLADEECFTDESHWSGLLEHPQYTRPEVWEGRAVPEVLLAGDHAAVARWRRRKQLERTMDRRPDMFAAYEPDREAEKLIARIMAERAPHRPVFDCRRAGLADIVDIMDIVSQAQAFMRLCGVDQWQNGYPTDAEFFRDMERGECWLFTCEGRAAGVATISIQPEECYRDIEGQWLTDGENYCVVHRSAVADRWRGAGLGREMLSFAQELAAGLGRASVRVDTHSDNAAMRGLLVKLGYTPCGIIYINHGEENGSPRVAYEKLL